MLAPVLVTLLVLGLAPRPARAAPSSEVGEGRLEDPLADGDLDVEDLIETTRVARSRGGTEDLRAGSWLTLGGIVRLVDGKEDVAAFLLLSVAFDRVAAGPRHQLSRPDRAAALAAATLAEGPAPSRATPAPARVAPIVPVVVVAPPAPPPPPPLLVTPAVARQAVAAAWKTSGLGVDDARIDAMVTRSRASATLPEARMRVMKVMQDSSKLGVIPTDASTYDLAGANLYLEARLTWRLDRLLFADDEPTLERTRLERQDARERISGKVIDTLFQWQRGLIARRGALAGSKEAIDAGLRMAESEAALDVLTGGWFGGWLARQPGAPGAASRAEEPP